jgi:hypothetical protein
MVKIKRSVANKEFIFGLMMVIIFVCLLFTWNVITNTEDKSLLEDTPEGDLFYDTPGAKVNVEVLPNPETEEGST